MAHPTGEIKALKRRMDAIEAENVALREEIETLRNPPEPEQPDREPVLRMGKWFDPVTGQQVRGPAPDPETSIEARRLRQRHDEEEAHRAFEAEKKANLGLARDPFGIWRRRDGTAATALDMQKLREAKDAEAAERAAEHQQAG